MNRIDCVRLVRALVDGPDAFWSAHARCDGFDGAAFTRFVHAHRLYRWFDPVIRDPRMRALLAPDFFDAADGYRAKMLRRHAGLHAAIRELPAALDAAGIGWLLMKGLVFAERFYESIDRRQQADLDLLVRRPELEAALDAMTRAGCDTEIEEDSGKPMAQRLDRFRRSGRRRVPHAIGFRYRGVPIDLHWCLRARVWSPTLERAVWADRIDATVAGVAVHTLSDDHALMFLLLSLFGDVRRGAGREKQFLDLYLLLRAHEREIDWDAFFARRSREGSLAVCVNVLAIFTAVWECESEFPGLARALAVRRRLVEHRDTAEALELLERPPGSRENRAWRRRVLPRSRWHAVATRLTVDLPHTLRRGLPG